MTTANRHNNALGALDPLTIQVDERSVSDHLNFAAAYGGLINFYDKHNRKNGSWRPFLLKDPMILLSAIGKTDYSSKHLLFILLSKKLETVDWTVGYLKNLIPGPEALPHIRLLVQLFSLIQSIFIDINDWLVQMDNSRQDYRLKDFIKKRVSDNLAPVLWRFLALRRIASQVCPQEILEQLGSKETLAADYSVFADFHPLWRSTINKATAHYPEDTNLLLLAQQVYSPLFSFYMQVVDSAKSAFNELEGSSLSPPDTALLIAFVKLMEVQREQLNHMTEKHLNFYYRDILKQSNKPAQADEAYLCLTLKKDAQELNLPAGAEFNAGLDEQQRPIVFAGLHAQTLNKIALKQVKTLRYCAAAEPLTPAHKLYLNSIETPAAVCKDSQGQLLSRPLFGADSGTELKQGFAFASPMLSLHSGERKLSIRFEWTAEVPEHYFDGCEVYLSTETEWFKSAFEQQQPRPPDNRLSLNITLKASDPAITRFAKNPDGFSSQWPLFKLVLSDSVDLANPPRLKKLTLSVEVDQYSAVELCNDNGKLDGNSAFLPFGPVPALGDNFYLGSNELFAKPLTKLELHVRWGQLPPYMAFYYQHYNEFLNKPNPPADKLCLIAPFNNNSFKVGFYFWERNQWQIAAVDRNSAFSYQVDELCDFAASDNLTGKQKQALCNAINSVLKKKIKAPITPENIGAAKELLTVAIAIQYLTASNKLERFLDDVEATMGDSYPLKTYESLVSLFQAEQHQSTTPKPSAEPTQSKITHRLKNGLKRLSRSKPTEPVLLPPLDSNSVFQFSKSAFSALTPDPALLLQPLDFSGPQKTGFLNMKLLQPVYGFGNGLYAQVVMDVTQQNAYKMTNAIKAKKTYLPLPMPNQPYAPKIACLSVAYAAEQRVDFANAAADNYPFELYHYDSFSCYPVYDRQAAADSLITRQRQSPGLASASDDSIRLFAGINASACLYLMLENVQPPCHLSLYFELTDFVAPLKDGKTPPLDFYYLAADGWRTLKILADDTNGLNCSGIIEVSISEAISPNNPLMPDSGYWLAITSTHPVSDFAGLVYLNTQAVKVRRVNPQGSAAPHIDAGKISGMVTPLPEVDALSQPFASVNGCGAEDNPAFYRRVSRRIKSKDRSSSQSDFELMAFEALPGLYFCKLIAAPHNRHNPGEVSLGLVNGYADPMLPDAYRPMVTGCNIGKAYRYFAGKMSPLVQLKLFNLSHESVKIEAKLKFAASAPINRLSQQIVQQLKIYLSPWIQSELLQITIDEGLSSASIIDYLTRFPEVDSVCSLKLTAGTRQVSDNFIIFPEQAQGLFVSAPSHEISAAF